jgi:hypothetical protein
MLAEDKYFQTLTKDELWQRYCGFLDLSIDEFMEIQKGLLMEQIELVADSLLGKKIMNNQKPKSVEEFRRMVPLTTYNDYEPYLSERQENALAAKPFMWCHSSGTGGSFKWIPHSPEIVEKAIKGYLACCILASCSKKGEINIAPGLRFLTVFAPPPYTSGAVILNFIQRFSSRLIPPVEDAETMEFRERIKKGFQIALRDGVDVIGSLASLLVRMGEEFSERTRNMKFSALMLHPKVASRFLKAWLCAKREKRTMLPKDLWPLKGILVSGLDTSIYKDDVAYYWGSIPYELYAGTEAFVYAVQGWNKKRMVFLPDMVFLEFIPYEELLKLQEDEYYQLSTVLLNEVEEDKLYEVVITHFHGMPLLRYRMNDIIKVIAKKDDEAGVNLPQIAFQRRGGEVINLAGLAQLDEKTLWQAIANTGIKHADWTACKEYDQNKTFLRLYLELKEDKEAAEMETMIDEELKVVDVDYKDVGSYLGLQPVRVTLLSSGTFQRYIDEKTKEGAELAHLKPAHVNPPGAVIQRLLELSEVSSEK